MAITARHLLHHTGGLTDYMALIERQEAIKERSKPYEPTAQQAMATLMGAPAPDFPAGTKYEYSNSGYMVLAQLVEKASGQPFPAFMAKEVFGPAGMAHTQVVATCHPTIPGRAISYEKRQGRFEDVDYTPYNAIYGDGNVNTTLRDMERWARALDAKRLCGAPLYQAMATSGRLAGGRPVGYGFGWVLAQTTQGERYMWHNGAWAGFRTEIARLPRRQFTVIVLSNDAGCDTDDLVSKIAGYYGVGME